MWKNEERKPQGIPERPGTPSTHVNQPGFGNAPSNPAFYASGYPTTLTPDASSAARKRQHRPGHPDQRAKSPAAKTFIWTAWSTGNST